MFSYKKAKNVLALTAALTVLCSQSVFAATLELDLDETIQRALLTNPNVKIAEYNRKAAKADYSAAKSARGISIVVNYRVRLARPKPITAACFPLRSRLILK